MAAELVNETPGVFDWTRSWSTHQYSTIAVHFPIYSYDYDEIVVDNEAYSSENEKKSVKYYLMNLSSTKANLFLVISMFNLQNLLNSAKHQIQCVII